MMESIKRPSKAETDEDLLAQQEKLLRGSSAPPRPCVQIVKRYKQRTQDQMSKPTETKPETLDAGIGQNASSNVVFSGIKEKNVGISSFAFTRPTEVPIPSAAEHRSSAKTKTCSDSSNDSVSANQKRESVFKANRPKSTATIAKLTTSANANISTTEAIMERASTHTVNVVYDKTCSGGNNNVEMIEGEPLRPELLERLKLEVHEDNVKKLTDMSEEEILAEREKLKKSLDPSLLSFLQSRKQGGGPLLPCASRISEKSVRFAESMDTESYSNDTDTAVGFAGCLSTVLVGPRLEVDSAPKIEVDIAPKLHDNVSGSSFDRSKPDSSEIMSSAVDFDRKDSAPLLEESDWPLKPSELWLHMNRPEPEKMAWMASLKERKSSDVVSTPTARFDFEGRLIPRTASTKQDGLSDVRRGLHHHGEEPEMPGYTIEELLRLGRSSMLNQRLLAINILAKVMSLCRRGIYDGVFTEPLLSKLLSCNFCTFVRHAIDVNTEAELAASLNLLCSFLCCALDEASVDSTFEWWGNHGELCLRPPINQSKTETDDQSIPENDESICQRDVVEGLVRMGILERFTYIFEMLHFPLASIANNGLRILVRLVRHSPEISLKLINSKQLISLIVEHFLPMNWSSNAPKDTISPYGLPNYRAINLLRILFSNCGTEAAEKLNKKHDILSRALRYLMDDPFSLGIPLKDACQTIIESYRLWAVFVAYGQGIDILIDLFPALLNHLQAIVRTNPDEPRRQFVWDRASSVLKLFSVFAAVNREEHFLGNRAITGLCETVEVIGNQFFQLSAASGIVEPLNESLSLLLACLLNCISTFRATYEECYKLPVAIDPLRALFSNNLIHVCLQKFQSLLTADKDLFDPLRCPSALLSFDSFTNGGLSMCPMLTDGAPVLLLTAYCRFLCNIVSYTAVTDQIIHQFLDDRGLQRYVDKILSISELRHTSHCFARCETYFLFWLVRLGLLVKNQVYFSLGLRLGSLVQKGDEALILKLFEYLILQYDEIGLEATTRKAVLEALVQCGHTITQQVENSRWFWSLEGVFTVNVVADDDKTLLNQAANDQKSLSRPHCTGFVCSRTWIFQPIHSLYMAIESLHSKNLMFRGFSEQQIATCRNNLLWASRVLRENRRHIVAICGCYETVFSAVCETFLCGTELFLDNIISDQLRVLLCEVFIPLLDQNNIVHVSMSSMGDFLDFFKLLLDQYESVSFGHSIFSQYVLFACVANNDESISCALFSDERSVLPFFSLALSECLIPVHYLENWAMSLKNKSSSASHLLMMAFSSGKISKQKNPLLYELFFKTSC